MARGSIEISFGMIFSIILMIAIIGVAVYAISAFLQVGKSAELSSFYQRLEENVNNIWASATTNKVVSFSLPKTIDLVCFGSIATGTSSIYGAELKVLKEYSSGFEQQSTNVFLYPPRKAGDFAFRKVDKIDLTALNSFDCFESDNGVVKIRLSKNEFDSLVKVQHE